MMKLKVIVIKECLNCPLSSVIVDTGDMYCDSGSLKKPDNTIVGNLKDYKSMIPDWCPLEDFLAETYRFSVTNGN